MEKVIELITAPLGGWDSTLATLIIFMLVDYITAIITNTPNAYKRRTSNKSKHSTGRFGIADKCCIILLIIVAVRLDILLNTSNVRNAVCISFCADQLLSILTNASRIGIPFPPIMMDIIKKLHNHNVQE